MLDSIDFKVNIRLGKLDLTRINDIKTIYDRKNKELRIGIGFKYKDIIFQYYTIRNTLKIHTNAHIILRKRDVNVDDYKTYIRNLYSILNELFDTNKYKIRLYRLDYCVDLNLGEMELQEYLSILKRCKRKYKYMKMKKNYETSIYLKTKRGKRNINIYDRGEKTKKNCDRGILRIELQQKESLIKGLGVNLKYFWNLSTMEEYFFDFLEDFFYVGDYYKENKSSEIINNSDISKKMKEKLKSFLEAVMKSESISNVKGYTARTTASRVVHLNRLKINPLSIPSNSRYEKMDNLLNLAYETAKEKYFNIT